MKTRRRIRGILLSLLLMLMFTLSNAQIAKAYNQWVDCVVVSSAGVSPFLMFGSPEYEIKLYNGCQGDMGSVNLDFDSGSFDVFSFNGRVSIYNLSNYSTTKTFSLQNIKPGFYFPKLKITATKDYSYKTINLPSYSIKAPKQPSLGNNGGSVQLQPDVSLSRQICTSSSIAGTNCTDYPNWVYNICSTNPSGILQEKVGSIWIKLWSFKGVRSTDCASKYPYSVIISGTTSKISGNQQMRLVFSKTATKLGWIDYFKVSIP